MSTSNSNLWFTFHINFRLCQQQLCPYSNNKQQLNNLLLPTCSLFQPICQLLCTFLPPPSTTIPLFATNSNNQSFCSWLQPLLSFTSFFFTTICFSNSTNPYINHFLVFHRSSLNFFGQTCHFYAKSSGGAM